ncbi:MAG: sensor domain-containing diguanylate cyclase [Acidobacteria bacterium]|nr:MAG: sensor domain-containing diguanylate cyclase [Acidobacteriota bacterium]
MPGAPRTNPAAPRGAQADLAARLRQRAGDLQDRLNRRDTLIELIRSVNATLDPRKVADALLGQVHGWFPAACIVVAVQDGSQHAALIAERGPCEPYSKSLEHVARWITEHNEEFMTASLATDERVPDGPAAAVIGFPLRCRARTIGALIALDPAASSDTPTLPPDVMSSLRAVLEGPALALDTMMHMRRFEDLSVTDDLTSLYNSRYLNQVLRRESKRASRSGRPLSLLFLDLDGFKSVNDRHGHLCGSRALVEAAAVIRGCARETDVPARFGGDEFALVLPDTGSEGAVSVAERVRERIAAHSFLKASDGLDIRLTASVGVATLPDVAASAEELIKAADAAMYRVKDRGKNGVVLATEPVNS